jgi:transcriptional antiterminator NusG
MSKQWYVVHTYSGYENKVKTSLEERLNVSGLREHVGQILVPMEDVVEVRGESARYHHANSFPGTS